MAWQVEDLELSVAEVDHIALVDEAGHLRSALTERFEGDPRRERRDEVVGIHRVAGRIEPIDRCLPPRFERREGLQFGSGEVICFGRVNDHIVELVMASDVIAVPVRCDRRDGLVEQVGHGVDEAGHTHAGVDDEVPVAASHMPDVATHQLDDVRLPQQRDTAGDRAAFEPTVSDRQSHARTVATACQARRVSTERELSDYYDNEAAAGARVAMGARGLRDDLRTDFVARLVAEQRETVVEIGSGPGTDASAFLDAGIDYSGFDLSVGNSRVAMAAALRIVPGSLFNPPFRPASFDAGWTMSTLLHVPDERFEVAMQATVSLLRPGAPLAIGLWGGLDREFTNDIDHFDPPRFFSLRSDDRVQDMLAPFGEIEVFESWPNDRSDWCYQFVVVRV